MKKLLTTLAVLTVVATPAFAQWSDPASSIGAAHSEKFYTRAYRADGAKAHAQARAPRSRFPHPTPSEEELLFDHAKGDIF